MDALRKRGTVAEHDAREARSTPDASTRAELDAALAAVSAEHRDAFLLVEVFGLSYQEAADVLGVAVGTVKSRMFRARRALCAAIAVDDEEAQ
jgi:RNA polymerase sigma-70 factor (ECF subfamily)